MTPSNHAFALSVLDRSHPQFPELDVMLRANLAHYRRLFRWADPDDLTQAAWVGLFQGALRFDPKRGVKLKTYSEFYVRKQIQREITPVQNFLNHTTPLEPSWDTPGAEPFALSLEVEGFLQVLTPGQRGIAERIIEGMTPAEISRELTVSKPRISAVIRRMRQIWLKDSVRRSVAQNRSIN